MTDPPDLILKRKETEGNRVERGDISPLKPKPLVSRGEVDIARPRLVCYNLDENPVKTKQVLVYNEWSVTGLSIINDT